MTRRSVTSVALLLLFWDVLVDARHHVPTSVVCTAPNVPRGCISAKQARRMGIRPTKSKSPLCVYSTQPGCQFNSTEVAIRISNTSKLIPAHVHIPFMSPLDDVGEQLLEEQRRIDSKTKVLKGCKKADTYCGTGICMCRTPGSWIGSFITLKISQLQKHTPIRALMAVLPGSGDIALRRFWEHATGLVSGSLVPEMGAIYNPVTGNYMRNCGGIRDDSQHLTFTAHMDVKRCRDVKQGSVLEPTFVGAMVDMS
eukprot:CAMPEP_0118949268 /NCGR_PEP_ID=MMETSP1169-20130426/49336_1 /TAXON_ID=36882 /ORGANISM="Pyramimonas obovata, Strain CCMP722" /LENGTH=253 /DNA_ID=CAMNT_0006895865 /DNA_START=63 /DNA_END=820 /DNA_ORIENTATION=+